MPDETTNETRRGQQQTAATAGTVVRVDGVTHERDAGGQWHVLIGYAKKDGAPSWKQLSPVAGRLVDRIAALEAERKEIEQALGKARLDRAARLVFHDSYACAHRCSHKDCRERADIADAITRLAEWHRARSSSPSTPTAER